MLISNCIQRIRHKECGGGGLQVFEREDGTVDGFCFSCDTYVRHPYGKEKNLEDIPQKQRLGMSKEQIAERIEEINNLGACNLVDRKLSKSALEYYGIKVGYSEKDGETIAYHHYPYRLDGELKSYKTRVIEGKRIFSVGDQKEVDLFGWDEAVKSGASRLIIVEGELDAPSLKMIIDHYQPKEYAETKPAVCSLPHGAAAAAKDIARLAPKIRRHFKQVDFCFDNDKAGQKATDECCVVMPEARVIRLPEKDANDCILNGRKKAAFKAAMFKAEKQKNTRLVRGKDVHNEARKPAEWGLSFPWEKLNKITRGLRFGETYYIAAGEKMGKSEVVNALGAHFMKEHGLKCLYAKPEEANNKTYKMLLSKCCGKVFHDPTIEFDEEAYDKAGEEVGDKIYLLNLYQHIGWESLKQDIVAAAADGVKVVFIDPITNLTNGMANGDVDAHLKLVAQEAAAMAMDLGIAIFFFCHLNKPAKGSLPWDRGGKITTDYFAGSSAMARSCNYAIGVEGNKDPELPEQERNMRKLVVLADREFGEGGIVPLYWSKRTHLFNEA